MLGRFVNKNTTLFNLPKYSKILSINNRRTYAQTLKSNVIHPRKKILTFQKTETGGLEGNVRLTGSNNETIIHPAFVTSPDLQVYLGKPVKPVVSITKCEIYDLDKVRFILSNKGIAPIQLVPNECITFKYKQNDVFIFKFGTITTWNVEETDVVDKLIPFFQSAEINSYKYQSEDLDYIEQDNFDNNDEKKKESYISSENEIICLDTSSAQQKLLDMLAFSYGLSRSTRLAILEEAVESHIKHTRSTIDKLSLGQKIAVNPKEALKLSGRLLLLRGKLNLYSELVETPDIYWSEAKLERIHEKISNALDISKRINMLNRKLDYLSEEAGALIGIMSTRTEVNLELIIIYLIVIEVCFEMYHFYERLGGKYNVEYFRSLLERM